MIGDGESTEESVREAAGVAPSCVQGHQHAEMRSASIVAAIVSQSFACDTSRADHQPASGGLHSGHWMFAKTSHSITSCALDGHVSSPGRIAP